MPDTLDSGRSLDDLLRGLEAPVPSPAGGTAAAVAAAMAASLVVMAGRESPAWPDGPVVAADAATLRDRLLELGAEDVQVVAAVLSAFRSSDAAAIAETLVRASDVPLEIAERAADVVELAARAATDGKRPLRPDARIAVILAEAATRAAASVVRVNVAALSGDGNEATKARLVKAADAAQARSVAAVL